MANLSSAPILDITDGKGNLVSDAPFRVLATMCHFDDSETRRRYLQTLSALTLLEIPDNVPKSQLVRAAHYARDAEAQIDKASNCAYGWAVAGDLLLLVLNAAVLAPEHATLARAIRVWTEGPGERSNS